MPDFLSGMLSTDFMPHGHCFFWRPEILWLHVVADSLTAFSYMLIPMSLVRIIRARKDLAFDWMFWLFGLFILFCGLTHIMSVVTLWHPVYRLEGVVKLLTALASLPTALLLIRLVPQAVAIPSAAELRTANESLRRLNAELEQRVLERTSALQSANEELELSIARLAESESSYRGLADAMPLIIWTAGPDGSVDYFNGRWTELTGLTLEESREWGWKAAIHPADLDRCVSVWSRALKTGGDYEIEYRFRRADGEYRWHMGRAIPQKDERGTLRKWYGTGVDIHDQKVAKEERERLLRTLQERETAFRGITESMPQLVWSARPDGSLDYFNRRWYEFTGLSEGASDGTAWLLVLHPEDRERVHARWLNSLSTHRSFEVQVRIRDAAGRYRWFLSRAVAVEDPPGTVARWFGTCTDIDDQRRSSEELLAANQDLEDFAYAASHDLQEPLRAISLYGELVTRKYGESLPEEGRAYLATMVGGAHRMSALLSDLRGYIRASHDTELRIARVDAAAVLEQVRRDLAAALRESGAHLAVGPLPVLWLDEVHLHQIFLNIIGNAVKYRREDRPPVIAVTAEHQNDCWRFSIADNGIGVDPEHRQKIFGVFKRLHGHRIPGTGIGLAICARIAQRYGGRIWVEENEQGGSTFHFTLFRVELPPA